MEDSTKNTISIFVSIFAFVVLSIFDEFPDKPIAWLGAVVFLTIAFFVSRFLLEKFLKTDTWAEVEKDIEIKNKEQLVQIEHQKQLQIYQETRNTFKYFSDSRLVEIHNLLIAQKDEGVERLALEEIMVEKGLISHSPMHEKIHALKKYWNQKFE